MTGPKGVEGAPSPEALGQATEELERLKQLLRRAGHGQAQPSEVQRAVTDYVQDHVRELATAAAAVGEQVRSQILAELYRWRAQLSQRGTDDRSVPAESERDE